MKTDQKPRQTVIRTLEKEGITEEQTFLDIAQNSRRLSDWNFEFPRPESTLEGYLFPDTYEFSPNTKPEKVLDVMLSNFSRRYIRPNRKEIAASGHTVHELVTIGSLIEREAEVSQDRARIAGVARRGGACAS